MHFAAREPALLDLMFAERTGGPSQAVRPAAEQLFGTMSAITDEGDRRGN